LNSTIGCIFFCTRRPSGLTTSETDRSLFVADGINDAPALMAATVGVAFDTHSDITTEAADAVVFEASLRIIDELIHIVRRMWRSALRSALGDGRKTSGNDCRRTRLSAADWRSDCTGNH